MSLASLDIRKRYRSNESNIANDFYVPCLSNANSYQRAAGYFTSDGLICVIKGLSEFVAKGDVIQLVVSPMLSEKDVEAINRGYELQDTLITNRLIEELLTIDSLILSGQDKNNLVCLSLLIATEKMIIKLAVPINEQNMIRRGIYHEKLGIFSDKEGCKVAFHGSANETSGGLIDNFESIMVFRSWMDPENRVKDLQEDFDKLWTNNTRGINVLSFPEAAKKQLIKFLHYTSDPVRPDPTEPESGTSEAAKNKWNHQDKAVEIFLNEKRGILEMATGTGKTRTAIKILRILAERMEVASAIITTDGVDLLQQWAIELSKQRPPSMRILRHFGAYHDMMEYMIEPNNSVLIISRQQVHRVLDKLSDVTKKRLFVVHDEVHGLGSPENINNLSGKHVPAKYLLGLSATPEREYDENGTAFIKQEIGDVIYEFGLADAIRNGILCEFDYYPLEFTITNDDRTRLHNVYKQQTARRLAGNPMSKEEVWMALARVYKTSESKLPLAESFFLERPDVLKRSLIFVEDKAYGEKVIDIIHKFRHDFHTYYADDERNNLIKFSSGDINCLITCHRISQGIDIRSLESVVLFSSNRSKLETIQRMGRCLRSDPSNPGKRAIVVDFIRVLDNESQEDVTADQERAMWLSELSKVRKEEHGDG